MKHDTRMGTRGTSSGNLDSGHPLRDCAHREQNLPLAVRVGGTMFTLIFLVLVAVVTVVVIAVDYAVVNYGPRILSWLFG